MGTVVVTAVGRAFFPRLAAIILAALVVLVGVSSPAAAQTGAILQQQDTAETTGEPGSGNRFTEALDCAMQDGSGLAALQGAFGMITGDVPETCGTVGAVQAGMGAVGDAIDEKANGAWENMVLSFGAAGAAVLKFALGWWISIDGQNEASFTSTLAAITEYTHWIQVAFLAASLMFLGGRLALARSGAIRETSEEGFRQLARATVIAGMIGTFVVIGTRISDGISKWFMDGTVGSDPAALVDAMVQVTLYAGPGGTVLLLIVGLIGVLGGLVMAFLLLMRMGFLVVISAALPIAAAAGGTKVGSQSYEKMIAWTLAFLLFKPVGSFVIGCAAMLFIQSAPQNSGDGMTALVGVMLLCSAALVLPSLMRLIVPAVGAVGGGGAGMAAAAGVGAAAVKVGAMAATGGGSAAAAGGATTATSSSAASAPATGAATSAPASGGLGESHGGDGGGGGGGSPQGGDSGTPTSQGSGSSPGGADQGTPTTQGGQGEPGAPGSPTGAPEPNNGGFEG